MNEKEVMLTRKKIETAYFIAKGELPLTNFERVLALEELHNVELDIRTCFYYLLIWICNISIKIRNIYYYFWKVIPLDADLYSEH